MRFVNAALTQLRALLHKRSVPQPAPPSCGTSTSSTAETAAIFSPEGVSPQDFSKGEIQATAEHSKIIPRAINYAEAQVINHRDVSREPKFDAGTELTE